MTPGLVAQLLRESTEELNANGTLDEYEDLLRQGGPIIESETGRSEVPLAEDAPMLPADEPESGPPAPPTPERTFRRSPMDNPQPTPPRPGPLIEEMEPSGGGEHIPVPDGDDRGDGVVVPVPDDADGDDYLNEVLVLELRPDLKSRKGRELDANKFDTKEKQQWDKADALNWAKHLKLGAVEILSEEESRKIEATKPACILQVPARFVRTAHENDKGEVEAKSRLVLPGHLLQKGFESGHARTDSPTAGLTVMCLVLALAAHFGWELDSFDVEAALLAGRSMLATCFLAAALRLERAPRRVGSGTRLVAAKFPPQPQEAARVRAERG